jgi:triacylglycerol lipase
MTTFPIVLVHGIARFDILAVILRKKLHIPDAAGEGLQYFKGIKSHLENHGFSVSHPNQSFSGSVDLRASQLRDHINEVLSNTGAEKVHIIGHSMGGLDARHMIVDKGMAQRVASLTTVGTPHHGSPVATRLEGSGSLLLGVLNKVLNLDVDGVADLTTTSCEQFNARAEDFEAKTGILYQTYSSSENWNRVFAPLISSWFMVREQEGDNDGVVSVKSQQWKKELVANDGTRNEIVQREFSFGADHLNQVGWWDPDEIVNPFFGGGSIINQAREYEQKVRDVYLDIAQHLP